MILVDQTADHEGPGTQETAGGAGQAGVCRRRLLGAGAGSMLGASLLVACGGSGSGSSRATSGQGSSPGAATDPGGGSGADRSPGGRAGGAGGAVLARVADVPVGGAVSAQDAEGRPVLVCQPRAGTFVAFSAICTHMGCTVAPDGGTLRCPCHGSTYDVATGDNTGGPAPSPLPEIDVTVRRGEVVSA